MTIGVDLCYSTGELSGGSTMSAATASLAGSVAGQVSAITVTAVTFGDVAHAASVAAGLVAARDGVAVLAGEVRLVHDDLTRRSGLAATAGEQMTADSTATAAQVGPGG